MNPVCIVSGCSRGIGRGIATKLTAQGYSLGLISRSKDALDNLKSELESIRSSEKQQFLVCPCDVCDESAIK